MDLNWSVKQAIYEAIVDLGIDEKFIQEKLMEFKIYYAGQIRKNYGRLRPLQ